MGRSHVSRCLRLVYLLQSRIVRTVAELGCEVGVSKRTVYRDLRLLENAGIPVRYDATLGGHVVDADRCLKISGLSMEELTALLLAAHTSFFTLERQSAGLINQAVCKLLGQATQEVRQEVSRRLNACSVESSILPCSEATASVSSEILRAIRQRRRVRITYCSPDEPMPATRTSVAPYRLVVSLSGSFLTGRSSVHRKTSRFDLAQIQHAELTDEVYTLPLSSRRLNPASGKLRQPLRSDPRDLQPHSNHKPGTPTMIR